MRKLFGVLGVAVLVGIGVPNLAPGAPAAASIRCLQTSPSTAPGSCTYRSTIFEQETLTAFALTGYTLDWVENGSPRHVECTAGPCSEPGLTFNADAGTTIHATVTQGILLVRQVAAAPPA